MTDYSAMSDFEINKAVAQALGAKPYLSNSGDFEKSISYGDEAVIISSKFKLGAFDPCNSWADAGPIIVGSRISLLAPSQKEVWAAEFICSGDDVNDGFEFDFFGSSDANPLRAAMIVFLMMKEAA